MTESDETDDWAAAVAEQVADGFGQAGSDASLAEEWCAALAEQGTAKNSGDVAAEWTPIIEDGETENLSELAGNDRIFQDNVEVSLDTITSVRFGDYLDAIPLPTLLGVFRADAWENSGLVTVKQNLAYSTLDLLLGGKRGGSVTRLDGRPFTTIEMSLVRRLVEIILSDLELSFQPLSPVRFAIDRIESNPRFATITRPGNVAILINLKLDMHGRGALQILFPHATIEPIRELLMQSIMGEKLGRDHVWESHRAMEIWQADVAMDAVLHELMLRQQRMLNLKIGDTLMFEQKPGDLVSVRCGDWALTQGRIGRVDDSIAVQIARPLRQSRTSLQAFEASLSNHSVG